MELINNLKEKAKSLKHRNCFYDGATVDEIEDFENKMNIILPTILKEFYLNFNGGFFADTSWSKEELEDEDDFGEILWNSNYFLRLDEIVEAYHLEGSFGSIDFIKQEKYYSKRLIPIMQTKDQEVLVWDATLPHETPILDAFHEYNANEWKILYPSF